MNIIDEVLGRFEFEEKPPILFDVGASGGLNPAWSKLAKYSDQGQMVGECRR